MIGRNKMMLFADCSTFLIPTTSTWNTQEWPMDVIPETQALRVP